MLTALLLPLALLLHHETDDAAAPVTTVPLADGVDFVQVGSPQEFIGSNSGFVVFRDFVLVIDASYLQAARRVIDEVKKATDKPIRFVFDTHHHGDHVFANGVYGALGATMVCQAKCQALEREKSAKSFAESAASNDPAERAVVEGAQWQDAVLTFDDKLVFDDGTQRVELIHLGTAHTEGDAVAWLPKCGVLFTGDACVNGAFNYMGDGDSGSWVRVLDRLARLPVKVVAPGHGKQAGGDLIATQRRWFAELRARVQDGLDHDLAQNEIIASFDTADLDWYREWTGVPAASRRENIARVYGELSGLVPPGAMVAELGLVAGPSPTKDSPGWTKPTAVVVLDDDPKFLASLRRVAPGVELRVAKSPAEAVDLAKDADAVIGACSKAIVDAGAKLRWLQVGSAGVERYVGIEALAARGITLTNAQRVHGPPIAEHVVAMLLALTRELPAAVARQREADWEPRAFRDDAVELRGKTALIVGLGGIGTEVAKLLKSFGMRIVATKRNPADAPDFLDRVEGAGALLELARTADVVVGALPLTAETTALFDAKFFADVKQGAIFVNVGRGKSVDTAALVTALKDGRLGGAALDVTDPEPLPKDHELWKLDRVLITPHVSARSDLSNERIATLFRENLRRFVAGEPLLNVVDLKAGY